MPRMPEQQQMTGGGPPHWGHVYKTRVTSVVGRVAVFEAVEDGEPIAISLSSEYSRKLKIGQHVAVDFRLLPDDPTKGK